MPQDTMTAFRGSEGGGEEGREGGHAKDSIHRLTYSSPLPRRAGS